MRNLKLWLLAAAILLAPLAALAGVFAPIAPQDNSGTIASTGVYQTLWNNDPNRNGCTIQNNGSNTMSVRVGGVSIWKVPGSSTFYCHWQGTVISSKIEITGTAGDAYTASVQ